MWTMDLLALGFFLSLLFLFLERADLRGSARASQTEVDVRASVAIRGRADVRRSLPT